MTKLGCVKSPSRQHYHSVDPETLALLEITLNETWTAVRSNGTFDAVSTRAAIADLTMQFAQQGQRDPERLKALVLAALPSYAERNGLGDTLGGQLCDLSTYPFYW